MCRQSETAGRPVNHLQTCQSGYFHSPTRRPTLWPAGTNPLGRPTRRMASMGTPPGSASHFPKMLGGLIAPGFPQWGRRRSPVARGASVTCSGCPVAPLPGLPTLAGRRPWPSRRDPGRALRVVPVRQAPPRVDRMKSRPSPGCLGTSPRARTAPGGPDGFPRAIGKPDPSP